jgi:hypothetical protein
MERGHTYAVAERLVRRYRREAPKLARERAREKLLDGNGAAALEWAHLARAAGDVLEHDTVADIDSGPVRWQEVKL